MVTLASQNAAGNQDHLGVTLDAPGTTHRLDAIARHDFRIEAIEVYTARHDRDFVPGRRVAVIDQLRDLLTRCDNAVAACHDAVVCALEDVLFAEPFVPASHKRNTAKTRSDERAPRARAAEGVNHTAPAVTHQPRQNEGTAQDY